MCNIAEFQNKDRKKGRDIRIMKPLNDNSIFCRMTDRPTEQINHILDAPW